MTILWLGMIFLGVNALLAVVGIYYAVLRKHQLERAAAQRSEAPKD